MSNILAPLVDGLYKYVKWNYDIWFSDDSFDFNDYFKTVHLKNKQEVHPKIIKTYQGTKGKIHLVNIPIGLSIDDFKKHKEGIKAQLGKDLEIRYKGKFIEIELIEKELPKKIDYQLPTRTKDSIYIPFANSLDGYICLDLKETPHTLCTGATGGGKSITTRNILTSLINLYHNELELYLIDFKVVELSIFKNLDITKCYVNEVEEAKEIICDLMEECKRRYKLFDDVGVTNIYDYNKKVTKDKQLKKQFIVIEEFIMLMEDTKKIAMKNLKKLASLSRASGQFLYITGQRFDNTVIDLVLRANIGNRICHKVESENDSKLIIDTIGADKLRGNGHIQAKINGKLTEGQSYYISDNQILEYTKKYIKKATAKPQREKEVLKDVIINKENTKALRGSQRLVDLSFLDNIE